MTLAITIAVLWVGLSLPMGILIGKYLKVATRSQEVPQ